MTHETRYRHSRLALVAKPFVFNINKTKPTNASKGTGDNMSNIDNTKILGNYIISVRFFKIYNTYNLYNIFITITYLPTFREKHKFIISHYKPHIIKIKCYFAVNKIITKKTAYKISLVVYVYLMHVVAKHFIDVISDKPRYVCSAVNMYIVLLAGL